MRNRLERGGQSATIVILFLAFAPLQSLADDPLDDDDGPALPPGAVLLGARGLDFPGSVGPWASFDDGKKIALANGRRIRIIDAATQKEIRSWISGRRTSTELAISPDGRRLATLDAYYHQIHIWDPETGELLKKYSPHRQYTSSHLSFSPDGKFVCSVGSERDPGQIFHTLTLHKDDNGIRSAMSKRVMTTPQFPAACVASTALRFHRTANGLPG